MVVSTLNLVETFIAKGGGTCDALSTSVGRLDWKYRNLTEVEIWRTSISVKIRKIYGAKLIKQQIVLFKKLHSFKRFVRTTVAASDD